MPNESILILETNPSLEAELSETLTTAGYQVYAADRCESLIKAVRKTRFPLVIVDSSTPDMTPGRIASTIFDAQPDTAVLFTGSSVTTSALLSMLRGGAVDFLEKPFDTTDVLERVRVAIQRRSRRRQRARDWQKRAKAAEHQLSEIQRDLSDTVLPKHYLDFGEYALREFLDLERRALGLERELHAAKGTGAGQRDKLVGWIAHPENRFANGVVSLGPQLNIDFVAQLPTGGEALDKLGAGAPDIIVLGDHLPDIPGDFVVNTVTTSHPNVQIVLVSGWKTDAQEVALFSGNAEPLRYRMDSVSDLISMLEEARSRQQDASLGHAFASAFKRRHEEFLRRYAELKAGG